ncbi:MAG: site-specific integrase [Thermoguttaceae bacterium]|nr:site-specific integrase [Thermoguttaceae bacterium]
MAYMRIKRDAKKAKRPITGYQIETEGKTIYFTAADHNKHEVETYRALIDKIEIERKKGAIYEGTLDEVKKHPILWRKLIDKGILDAPKAESWTLAQLRRAYIEAGHKSGKAPGTLTTQSNSITKLETFFGAITLDKIDEESARAFADYCDRRIKNNDLSVATRATYIKDARALFNWAVKAGIVATNPFAPKSGIVRGSYINREKQEYIDQERTRAVLEACRNSDHPLEWRALFALARFQGLRIPNESRALRWQDVDFDNRWLIIPSQKTKRFEGKDKRGMPIFSPTLAILQELRESQPRGQAFVFADLLPLQRREGHRTGFARILERAGINIWPRLFDNLRSSASTDVKQTYGDTAETRWIGHSKQVAEDHYYQVLPSAQRDEAKLFGDW